jgi:hypothetical protein
VPGKAQRADLAQTRFGLGIGFAEIAETSPPTQTLASAFSVKKKALPWPLPTARRQAVGPCRAFGLSIAQRAAVGLFCGVGAST